MNIFNVSFQYYLVAWITTTLFCKNKSSFKSLRFILPMSLFTSYLTQVLPLGKCSA